MSTQETIKRAATINDNLRIQIGMASLVHRFLFGEHKDTRGDSVAPVAPALPPDAPYFDRLIQVQIASSELSDTLYTIINDIASRLEIDKSTLGGKPTGSSGRAAIDVDRINRLGGAGVNRPFQPEESASRTAGERAR